MSFFSYLLVFNLISIFEDNPDDYRCADEGTDGIDRECVAIGRELACDVAK